MMVIRIYRRLRSDAACGNVRARSSPARQDRCRDACSGRGRDAGCPHSGLSAA